METIFSGYVHWMSFIDCFISSISYITLVGNSVISEIQISPSNLTSKAWRVKVCIESQTENQKLNDSADSSAQVNRSCA